MGHEMARNLLLKGFSVTVVGHRPREIGLIAPKSEDR